MLLTVALTGCRKEPLPASSDVIGFVVTPSVHVEAETKADALSGESDLIKNGSQVLLYGSYKIGSSTAVELFKATPLTCTESSGSYSWGYGAPVRYWVKDATHDFRAVFPASANVSNDSNSSSIVVSYDASSANQDLMVAAAPNATPKNPVSLTFNHACAAVRFALKTSGNEPNTTCTITSLKLNGVAPSGKMTFTDKIYWTPSAAPTLGWTWTWPEWNGKPLGTSYVGPWYYVVPQTLSGATLQYTYTFGSDSGSVTLTIPNITWESGKVYVYQVNIGMSSLTVSIEDWDAYSSRVNDIAFPTF